MTSTTASLASTTSTTPAPTAQSTAISRKRAKQEARAAKAALHNAKLGHDDSKKSRRKTRYADSQFRLLSLPAELRNLVYTKVLETSARCAVKGFRIPPLLQVCKQIRAETVGLPTAVNSMDFVVRSNYVVVLNDNILPHCNAYFHHDIGLLQLNDQRDQWFAAPEVVFRDIRIVAQCACCPQGARLGAVLIAVVDGGYTVNTQVWYLRNKKALEKVFAGIKVEVKKVLKAAEARPGFAGLELADVQNIARCCHWIEVIDLDDD